MLTECLTDFNPYSLILIDEKFPVFSRLFSKETSLTTPSVIVYITTKRNEINKPLVDKLIKCYLSSNPKKDIESDKELFETFDEILIRPNVEDIDIYKNQILSARQKEEFENDILKIRKHYEIS